VLAHLEHLNLAPLLEHLNWFHVCLLHSLDGSLGTGDLVLSLFDEAELSLAKCLSKLIKVE